MKVGLITDLHFGIRQNNNFFLDYQLDYFNEVVFPKFKEQKVETILFLGDFFSSRKNLDIYTYHQVKHRFLDKLLEYGFKLKMVPGNHDLYFTDASDITSLSVLSEYSNVEVFLKPTVLELGEMKIGMIPWISNEKEKEDFFKFAETCKCSTLAGHFEINSYFVMPGIQHQGGLKEADLKGFDIIYSGHFHIRQRRPDSNIFYIGTIQEYDWGDHAQSKGFYILDTATQQTEFIKNERYLHYKVVYDENKLTDLYKLLPKLKKKIVKLIVANKQNEKLFTSFVYNLEQMGPILYSIIDTLDTNSGELDEHFEEENVYNVIETYVKEKYEKHDALITILKKLYQDSTPQTSNVGEV